MSLKLLKNRTHLFYCLLIIILGFIIYSNTFNAEFQFDDNLHIVNETQLNDLSVYSDLTTWLKINDRPLSYFTLALNRSINGDAVFAYHLFNLMVHLLTSLMVYFLTYLILSQPLVQSRKTIGKEKIISLFVALIFLCHPIQTQAVSYIVQRMTSMAALFYISSVYFYFKFRLLKTVANKKHIQIIYLFVTAIFAIAAILSKQIAATIPAAYLLVEFYFIRNKEGKRYSKFLLAGIIGIGITLLIVLIGGFLPKETETIGRFDYFITQLRVIVKYVQLLVLPISQNLDYDFPVSQTIWGADELLSLIVVSSLLVSVFTLYKKYPLHSFGLAWFFITLAIESSFIPIQDVIFEHRLYLPMFGFALILIISIIDVFSRYRIKRANQFIIFIIVVLSIATYARNNVWKNKFTLWSDVVRKSPSKARPHLNLGITYIHLLEPDLAIRQFNIAKKLEPGKWDRYSYFNLGDAYLGMQKPVLAIEQFNLAQSFDTQNWKIYFKRAEAYLLLDRNEEALNDLNVAISLNEASSISYEARGRTKMKLQKFEDAIADFTEALRIEPKLIPALFNRSNARLFAGDINGALADLDQTINLNPNFAPAYNNRGQINYNLNNYEDALADLNRAIEIDPKQVGAYNARAKVFIAQEQFYDAIVDLNNSLLQSPEEGEILKMRGECYFKTNQLVRAYNDFIEAKKMGILIDDEILKSCERSLNLKNQGT